MNDAAPEVEVVMEPVFVDKATAAKALGNISQTKLKELMHAGRIHGVMLGGRVMFTPDEIRRFAATCPSWEPA